MVFNNSRCLARSDGVKKIPLRNRKKEIVAWAMVDDEDYASISQFTWCLSEKYAMRKDKGRKVFMHRVIARTKPGYETDHIDGNGLNNTKANLRGCLPSQNRWNTGKPANNKSGHKGVCWIKRRKQWDVRLQAFGKSIWVGNYKQLDDAIAAYRTAATKYHGEFSHASVNN